MSLAYELGRQLVKRAGGMPGPLNAHKPNSPIWDFFKTPNPRLNASGFAKRPDVNHRIPNLQSYEVPTGQSGGRTLEQVLGRPAEMGQPRHTPVSPQFMHTFMQPMPYRQWEKSQTPYGDKPSLNAPWSADEATSYLHGRSARADLGSSLAQQGFKLQPRQWSSAGNALLKQRHAGESLPSINWDTNHYPQYTPFSREVDMPGAEKRLDPLDWYQDVPSTLNHELEHHQQNPGEETSFDEWADRLYHTDEYPLKVERNFLASGGKEIASTLGDLVFMAEEGRQTLGKPVEHTIRFPGGKEVDADWAARMARQHGYFDGRSMQGLLQTPEGLSFTNQVLGGGDYTPPPYQGSRALMAPTPTPLFPKVPPPLPYTTPTYNYR